MQPAEYAALAAVEDRMWYFRALHRLIEAELVRALGGRAAAVLDAGCGTGGLIRRLAPRHGSWAWTGLDASESACGLARGRTAVKIVQGRVEALPFADGSFDAVVLADVLYHLDDDIAGLRECRRVLREGGLLVATVPAYRWLWSYHDEAVEGRRRYGRREILDKMGSAGFGAIRATHWNALVLPLVALRRKALPRPKAGSDVRQHSAAVEAVGGALFAVERAWLSVFNWLPFGVSILAAAVAR